MSIRFFSSGNLNYKAQAWTNKYNHWRFIHARTSNWQKDFGCSKQHSKFVNSKDDKKKKNEHFLAKFNQILKITYNFWYHIVPASSNYGDENISYTCANSSMKYQSNLICTWYLTHVPYFKNSESWGLNLQ